MIRAADTSAAIVVSVQHKAYNPSSLLACLAEFAKGNFEVPLEQFPGKKAFINRTVEELRANLKALITDANLLVKAASLALFEISRIEACICSLPEATTVARG